MADEQSKDTGKYIEISNILANKENLNDVSYGDASSIATTQFTAEEFNGIVRALKELYEATSEREFWVNEFVDGVSGGTGSTSSRNITLKEGEDLKLIFTYISRYRKGFKEDFRPREEDQAHFTISVRRMGSNATSRVIYDSRNVDGIEVPIKHGTTFEIDVKNEIALGGKFEFLISGENISESFNGDDSSRKFSFYYTVIVTNMSLAFDLENELNNSYWWATPIVSENSSDPKTDISFIVEGSGNRELVVTTSINRKTPIIKTITTAGRQIIPVSISIPKSKNTVVTVYAYLQNTDDLSIKTDEISREFMVLRPDHDPSNISNPVKLAVVNELKSTVGTGSEHVLFKYAIYDNSATSGYSSVTFNTKLLKDGETVIDKPKTLSVKTQEATKFSYDFSSIEANNDYTLLVSASVVGKNNIIPEKRILVDNSTGSPAISGAIWYLNPSGRSNNEQDYMMIKNSMNGTFTSAVWENFTWSENDGWCTRQEKDAYGTDYTLSSLRVPAGAKVNINYQPLDTTTGKVRTVEIDYKISNISDLTTPAITIVKPRGGNEDDTMGIKIYPNKICTATSSKPDHLDQQIMTDDGVRIRATILTELGKSYYPSGGNTGSATNFVRIYIDGVLAKVYNIDSNDRLSNSGNIIIGSPGCDVEIYGIRVYQSPLNSYGIVTNYINRLNTSTERAAINLKNDVLGIDGSTVDFEKALKQYNIFVFDGDNWPGIASTLAGTKTDSSVGNLYLYSINNVGDTATKNGEGQSFMISDVTVKGQGTTSMEYYEWNLQFKGNKKTSVVTPLLQDTEGNWYADESRSEQTDKVKMFSGVPKANAIVMKKNWASSMQDHKMGSVNSFTSSWKHCGLSNAATEEPESEARVSVYQEPMLGFWKKTSSSGDVVYIYKGLFTGGPHKGDKQCFGYDSDKYPELISIEGSDNDPLFTNFLVPWRKKDERISYTTDKEAFIYDGELSWDYNFGPIDSEDDTKINDILDFFEKTFRDPYKIVFDCSQNLYGFNGTEEELALSNSPLGSYWLPDYSLYFKNKEGKGVEKLLDDNGNHINLLEELGDILYDYKIPLENGSKIFKPGTTKVSDGIRLAETIDEKNEIFKSARRIKFRNEADKYWDIEDALFQHCWIEFFAGTDQRGKNTYPYSYQVRDEDTGELTKSGKWKWRLDDADTIGPIDNTGIIAKPYHVEVHDVNSAGTSYWNAGNNQFWNLIETLEEKYAAMMKKLLNSLIYLGKGVGSPSNQLLTFYEEYFVKIKKYFPELLYNLDSEKYERAGQDSGYGKKSVAMNQSLGNAYSPEYNWYKNRIEYISSKYIFGNYAIGKDNTHNSFICRIGNNKTAPNEKGELVSVEKNTELTFTTAMDFYPVIDKGETNLVGGIRRKTGDTFSFNVYMPANSGDVSLYIRGASHYLDLGDLHDIYWGAGQKPNFEGFSKIKELKLGHPDPDQISSQTDEITVPSSLNKLYLENYKTLTTVKGLDNCVRLKEVNAKGTKISRFDFPSGITLESVIFPETLQNIRFLNCSTIQEDNIIFNGLTNIIEIFIDNTPGIKAISLLKKILEDQKALPVLKYINIKGVDETFTGKPSVDVLDLLVKLTEKDKYFGISSSGATEEKLPPTITGKISVEFAFERDEISLESFFPGLDITVRTYYVYFEDNYVRDTLKDYMRGLGYLGENEEITTENAKKVTSLKNIKTGIGIFNNVNFDSFDELKYFTEYTTVDAYYGPNTNFEYCGDFQDCKARSIALDNITVIRENGFRRSGLEKVVAPKLISLGSGAFAECKDLAQVDLSNSSLSSIGSYAFSGCTSLKVCKLPETLNSIGNQAFDGATSLTELTIPSSCGSIGSEAFLNTGITTIYWNWKDNNAPTLPMGAAFGNKIQQIYMPKEFIDNVSRYPSWEPYKDLLVAYDFSK